MTRTGKDRKKAVALRYQEGKDSAPRVTAKGEGAVAEKILRIAEEAGISIREDKDLVEVLSRLDLDAEIPPDTYTIVAEILAWVYRMNKSRNG